MNDYKAVDTRHEAFAALSYNPRGPQVSNAHRAQTLATIYVGDQLTRIVDVLEKSHLGTAVAEAFDALSSRDLEDGIARARAGVVLQDALNQIKGESPT